MQQLTPRPIQPGHASPYIQTNRPLASAATHSQPTIPHLGNHMPGLAVSGAPPHPSYSVWLPNLSNYLVVAICLNCFSSSSPLRFLTMFCTFSSHHLMASSKIILMQWPNTSLLIRWMLRPVDNLGCPLYLRVLQLFHQCSRLEYNPLVLHQQMQWVFFCLLYHK